MFHCVFLHRQCVWDHCHGENKATISPNGFALWIKIWWYISVFTVPSILRDPQHIWLKCSPKPWPSLHCVIQMAVGTNCCLCWPPMNILTRTEPNISELDSSVYMSHWYWFWVQFLCTLAYLSLFLQCCPFLLIAQPLFHCYLFDEPSVNNRWINWINLSVLCRDFVLPLLLFSTSLVSLNCLRTYCTPRFQLIAL